MCAQEEVRYTEVSCGNCPGSHCQASGDVLFSQCLNGSSFSEEQAYNSFLHGLNTWKTREKREGGRNKQMLGSVRGRTGGGGSSKCKLKSVRPIPPKTPQSTLVETMYPKGTLVETLYPKGKLIETVSNRYIW